MDKNRKSVRYFLLCVIVAVTMCSVLMTGCGDQDKSIDVSYITTKLEGISELATAKMTMKGIIHVEEGKIPLIDKKEFYMIYRATIKAGFDLSQAEINVTESAVTIKLPQVSVFDVIVDDEMEFIAKTDSLFNKESMEDTAEAIAMAKEDVLAQPEIEELKQTAEKQVKELLTSLLADQIGDRELIIKIG